MRLSLDSLPWIHCQLQTLLVRSFSNCRLFLPVIDYHLLLFSLILIVDVDCVTNDLDIDFVMKVFTIVKKKSHQHYYDNYLTYAVHAGMGRRV